MEFISMDIAMKYLMSNMSIFTKIKNSFLNSYRNYKEEFHSLLENQNIKELELYIHSIKGISLNLGASKLYDASTNSLNNLRKGILDNSQISYFYECLEGTYCELMKL